MLTAVLSCGDLELVDDQSRSTADLLILGLQTAGRPVTPGTAFVKNGTETFVRAIHNDQFRTLYLEVRFSPGSLASVDGQPLGMADSVLLVLEPALDVYGATVSPSDLAFTAATLPHATFTFASYGDLSVADGSSRYASRSAYADALALWYEGTPGRWERVTGSGFTGNDAVSGSLRRPGTYVVAAPR